MTDAQVLQYAARQKLAGVPDTDIATGLLERGATPAQLQKLSQQYSQEKNNSGTNNIDFDNSINTVENRMRENNGEKYLSPLTPEEYSTQSLDDLPRNNNQGKKVFGRDIFNNKNLTFEPQMNIATPQNYVLGPGDEIIIDI